MRKLFKFTTLFAALMLAWIGINIKTLKSAQDISFYTVEDFKNLFLDNIKRELTWINGTLTIENFRVEPENLKIPKSAYYKTKFISNPRLGANNLLVTFFSGKNVEVVRLWGYVEVYHPVVVTKRPISNKSILTEEDMALEIRPLSKLPQDIVLDIKSLIGKQLKTSLKAGTVLRTCYIEDPIIVKNNSLVEIIAKNEKLIVRTKGKALQNGRIGEMIKVQNLSSKKVIVGKVVSASEVEVNF